MYRRVRALMCLTLLLSATTPAGADWQVDVELGWAGFWRPERWTPARVVVHGDSLPVTEAELEWYVPRPGREAMRIRQYVTLDPRAGRPAEFRSVLPVGPEVASLHLRLVDVDTGTTLAWWPPDPRQPQALVDAQLRFEALAGVVGGDVGDVGWLPRGEVVRADVSAGDLPATPVGFETLDLLLLSDVGPDAIDPDVQRAVVAWVSGGGRLAWWPGSRLPAPGDPLASLLPVPPDRIGRDGARLTITGPGETTDVTTIVRGLGRVDFLHVRPDAVDSRWHAALRPLPPAEPFATPPDPEWDAAVASARDYAKRRFTPGITLLALAAVVGPLDWLLLRRTSRRVRRWWTLPGWLLCVALLGTWAVGRRPPPAELLVQVNDAGPVVRGRFVSSGNPVRPFVPASADALESLAAAGPVYWMTSGFDRTTGPWRDVEVVLTPRGTFTTGGAPVVAGRAVAYPLP